MMVGDALTTNALEHQEQRAQCLRFCMTMFLLFSTFFLVRVQQDTYSHNYERRRRKGLLQLLPAAPQHNDPLMAPEAASLDVVYVHRNVSRGLWVRGATGTGPVLTSAFVAFLPGDAVPPVPSSPDGAATTSGTSSSSTAGPVGYFDTYEPLAYLRQATPTHGSWALESSSPWGPKMHTTALAEVGASGFPSVLAVYRDTRLFRNASFPGCDSSGGANNCLLALLRLPLSACLATKPGSLGAALPISWTCSDLLNGVLAGHPTEMSPSVQWSSEDPSEPGCIRLVSGSSLFAITGYATEALKRPYLMSTANAGTLVQFCGAPLPELISVDSIAGRVFFVQRSKPPAATRRLSEEGAASSAAEQRGEPMSREHRAPVPSREPPLADRKKEKSAAQSLADGLSVPDSGAAAEDIGGEGLVLTRRLEEAKEKGGLASICVAYAYLDGFYDDVSRCLPVATEPEGNDALGEPVYMQVDPLTDALMFAAYDREGQLVLSLHHSLTLKRKFAVRFEGFKSGRLMSAEFSSLGKILVTGDEEPYKHHLDIIDVATGYHERIDISPT